MKWAIVALLLVLLVLLCLHGQVGWHGAEIDWIPPKGL